MLNIKSELFKFKKGLSENSYDIYDIVDAHYKVCDEISEKKIIESISEALKPHFYDKGVKSLVESFNLDLSQNQLTYDLKHLYNILSEQAAGGTVYRQVLNTIVKIVNTDDSASKLDMILNELNIHTWIPEVKMFLGGLQADPIKRSNIFYSGVIENVYTVVERVEEGSLAYVGNSWFLITEKEITKTDLNKHFGDLNKLREMRLLEEACKLAMFDEDSVVFEFDDNLRIGVSTKNKGALSINGEEVNENTTLETLFSSSLIPHANRGYYPMLEQVVNNIDKFLELDIAKHISNDMKPTVECFVFNYGKDCLVYKIDKRNGSSLYTFESATDVVNEVKHDLSADLTDFFKKKLSKEEVASKKLEDKEQAVNLKLEQVQLGLSKLQAAIDAKYNAEGILEKALSQLKEKEAELLLEQNKIKEAKYKNRDIVK
jgi:hypothetical protein